MSELAEFGIIALARKSRFPRVPIQISELSFLSVQTDIYRRFVIPRSAITFVLWLCLKSAAHPLAHCDVAAVNSWSFSAVHNISSSRFLCDGRVMDVRQIVSASFRSTLPFGAPCRREWGAI